MNPEVARKIQEDKIEKARIEKSRAKLTVAALFIATASLTLVFNPPGGTRAVAPSRTVPSHPPNMRRVNV
ncbi:hypothetical protein A2U01_0049110 [Trifolium medium]|uniref:Uncharacterized protein n=1 Tax=Trifolium medium TaxID=97028 RepID=A0A392QWE4_9FABA|nr:hypothetical protein [Trifolium medium]